MKAGLEEKEILILELIRSAPEPIGSWYIVNYLNEKGIRVSSATVGRVLNKLENQGYLQKEKFKGRVITEKGYQVIQYDHGLKQMADEQSKIVELIDHTQRSNLMNILNARLAIEPQLAAIAAEFAKNGVSINGVNQDLKPTMTDPGYDGEIQQLRIVTHLTDEETLRNTVKAVQALDFVTGDPSILRVLD